jgi:hypothetical protein
MVMHGFISNIQTSKTTLKPREKQEVAKRVFGETTTQQSRGNTENKKRRKMRVLIGKVSEIIEGIFYRKNQQEDTLLSVGDEIYNDDIVYQEEAINSNLSFFILELKTGEKVKIGSKGLDDILYDELFNSKDLSSMGYVDITEEETMSGEEKEEESHSKGENK